MAYESVDRLQKVLEESVFHYAKDAKKAAGRALGTLVEIITFYLVKSWGFEYSVAIEKALAEYGNVDITHNVEFSLHPLLRQYKILLRNPKFPISPVRILSAIDKEQFPFVGFERKSGTTLLSSDRILRNSCVIAVSGQSHLVATLASVNDDGLEVVVLEQFAKPYAMFECKRVGIEEGAKRGPQTIEKAKQGAYVAKSVSSLHKIRLRSGKLFGLVHKDDDVVYSKPYAELIAEIMASDDVQLLRDFILTVGVVSNHGNWFTLDNHNKELKVLAQSYDWLVFLTDEGLSNFITELLLNPLPLLQPARTAFLASYAEGKTKNQFTKVQMNYEADQVLQMYFKVNRLRIEKWFNILTPKDSSMQRLRLQLGALRGKNWRKVHSL